MEGELQDAQAANNLDIWQKLAMSMFMIPMHHHLPLQSQRESEARKILTIVPSCAADPPQE